MRFTLKPAEPKPVGKKIRECPDGWYTSKEGNLVFKEKDKILHLSGPDSCHGSATIGDGTYLGNLYFPFAGEVTIQVP